MIGLDVIRGWFAPYLFYLKIAGLVALVLAGWYARGVYERAQQVEKLNTAIAQHLGDERESHLIGLDLETGLNKYRLETLQLDRKVNDAITSTGCRFDAGGVQRTAERIAAGSASRKRGDPMR